ncbi:MAG TPA: cyclopropane-fatty-acyl-phospholipid synthase family protein [Pseudolabrys sp.]|nr:cyclopropane-fatty-acyl-phospholipid synthase family protein [Pseudolabrys sp.]
MSQTSPSRSLKNIVTNVGMLLLRGLLRQIIRKGTLTVIAPDGGSHCVGNGAPTITIRILDRGVIPRLLLNPDLAFGEAYMDGTLVVEDSDIYDFLDLCFANMGWSSGHGLRRVRASVKRLARRIAQHNSIPIARANVAHHYDLSDSLYELFLDADRQYSCAYFVSPEDTLERAQEQKKRHLAAKLLLRPGQQVLDIGSGWGGLGLYLADLADVDVTGLTLSTEQHAYAQRRANEIGMGDQVRFLLRDYRQEDNRYDRIVSVGMFEHVGISHYQEFFEKISDLLDEDGIALIHTIGRADGPGAANAWINKYIFPGGYVPALSEILPAIERAGLYVTDIEVLRLHYAETLKAWRQRFIANRKRVAEIYDDRFCRMWEFYLAGCEAAFRYGGLINLQIQLSKRINAVPLTRDYIAGWEHSHLAEMEAAGFPRRRSPESSGDRAK